jgi:DNA-binding response OmpR family regulator
MPFASGSTSMDGVPRSPLKKILVVDDEPEWLALAGERLAPLGHEVITTSDFMEALEIAETVDLDLIVLDIRMPLDGRILFRYIRSEWPELPVMIHTVYQKQLRFPALSAARDCVIKTVDCRGLIEAVERCLGRAKGASPAPPEAHEDREVRRPEVRGRREGSVRRGPMIRDIGECAGKVWQVLNKTGKAPLDEVSRETGLTPREIHRAVGWLARENKISIVEDGKRNVLQLNGIDHR